MNTEQLIRNPKESHRRDAENAEVPSLGAHASSFQRARGVRHPARRMRALPGARGGKSLAACKGFSA